MSPSSSLAVVQLCGFDMVCHFPAIGVSNSMFFLRVSLFASFNVVINFTLERVFSAPLLPPFFCEWGWWLSRLWFQTAVKRKMYVDALVQGFYTMLYRTGEFLCNSCSWCTYCNFIFMQGREWWVWFGISSVHCCLFLTKDCLHCVTDWSSFAL